MIVADITLGIEPTYIAVLCDGIWIYRLTCAQYSVDMRPYMQMWSGCLTGPHEKQCLYGMILTMYEYTRKAIMINRDVP